MSKNYETRVACYSRIDQSHVVDYPFDVPEPRLRELLHLPPDEFIGDAYLIPEDSRDALAKIIGRPLPLETCECFVELFALTA